MRVVFVTARGSHGAGVRKRRSRLIAYDVAIRGAVVDYISLPGVVVADLKDILLSFGVSAFLVEAIENPAVSVRWNGWRSEYREVRELVSSFSHFAIGTLFGEKR
jgi:hypothetical protein